MLKKDMIGILQSEKLLENTNNNLKSEPSFYDEQYIFQNYAPPTNFSFFDFDDKEIGLSEVYKWNGLVLHINDVNCTDCNVKRLNLLLKGIEESGLNDLLVIANFESHAEFKKMVIETGLDKYKVYNSTFNLKQLHSDTILLFYFEGSTIKYPFVVVDENMVILPSYLEFIKSR